MELLGFFQGIKVTATTPSSTAVCLQTGSVNLEVSNNEDIKTDVILESKLTHNKFLYSIAPIFNSEKMRGVIL